MPASTPIFSAKSLSEAPRRNRTVHRHPGGRVRHRCTAPPSGRIPDGAASSTYGHAWPDHRDDRTHPGCRNRHGHHGHRDRRHRGRTAGCAATWACAAGRRRSRPHHRERRRGVRTGRSQDGPPPGRPGAPPRPGLTWLAASSPGSAAACLHTRTCGRAGGAGLARTVGAGAGLGTSGGGSRAPSGTRTRTPMPWRDDERVVARTRRAGVADGVTGPGVHRCHRAGASDAAQPGRGIVGRWSGRAPLEASGRVSAARRSRVRRGARARPGGRRGGASERRRGHRWVPERRHGRSLGGRGSRGRGGWQPWRSEPWRSEPMRWGRSAEPDVGPGRWAWRPTSGPARQARHRWTSRRSCFRSTAARPAVRWCWKPSGRIRPCHSGFAEVPYFRVRAPLRARRRGPWPLLSFRSTRARRPVSCNVAHFEIFIEWS